MRKILISMAMLSLTACAAKTYLEESKENIEIPLSASYDTASEGVHLGWSVNWDNTTFQILRGTDPENLSIYVSNAYQLNWVDTDADAGTEYYYLVKAFTQSGRHVGHTSVAKGYRSYQDYAKMHAPTEVSADQSKYGGLITLYWYGQEESRFRIYRSDAASGDYKLLAEVKGLKYIDTNVRPKQTWYYKISSVGKDHTVLNPIKLEDSQKERYYNGSEAGANSIATAASVEGSTADSPVGVQATTYTNEIARTGAIQVTWDWDDQADYYRIYRSDTEDGEYKLIAPYSRDITNLRDILSGFFNDKSMSNVTGTNNGDTFVYPEYFYQISAVKNNEESAKSLPAAKGSALDKKDVLPAPEDVLVKIKTAKEPGFAEDRLFPVIDAATGKYLLNVTWKALPSEVTDGYLFNLISSNTVSKEVKTITNNLPIDAGLLGIDIENPDFNQEILYSVVAINTSKGSLAGNPGEFLYRSLTPLPPAFNAVSQLKRVEITNEEDVKIPTHTQYETGSRVNYIHRSVGWVSKRWTTAAVVGDIDLEFTPASANMQKSYNIYRRLKTAGDTESWQLIDKEVNHSNSIDDPTAAVPQIFNDNTLTEAQLKGSGTVSSPSNFYPKYEYRVTAVNDGIESALTPSKEGQAINPKDILPAPSYLTIPFHYAKGTGIAFWSRGWTVRKHDTAVEGVDITEGFDQIEGKSGSAFETQRIFITWDPISNPGGVNFDYRFRHVRSAYAALDGKQHAQSNYLVPGSWYTHGGMGQQTWVKLNNETSGDSMTYLYDVVDSAIAGVAGLPTYNPGSAFFAVSATNKSAGGLDGNTIGVYYIEAPENPYGSSIDAPKNVNATLLTDVYPYKLKLTWDAVASAVKYSILTLKDEIEADGRTNKKTVLMGTVDAKGSGNEYIITPDSEFVLGADYTYYVQAETTAPGEAATVVYTHKTPYKLKMVSTTTNKLNYTTNITTPNTVTWIENESFADGASSFNKGKRNVGFVKKTWEVTATGGTVDLHLSYGRFGSLPSSYNIQRRPQGGSWDAAVNVPITSFDGSAAYTDNVPAPGVYHYSISAVYQGVQGVSGLDGAVAEADNYPVGVALDTAKLSPAPGYLNVPFHWAFGSPEGGYKLAINQISESPEGIAQIKGAAHGGQALWLTWKPVSAGTGLRYAVRVAPGVSDIPSGGAFSEVPLAGSGDTKIMISNHAGLGKTALYASSETTRTAYRQDSAAFDVTVSNTFADALGNTVTVAGGSKGILFFESADPYTEDNLAASSLVTASLDKEAYVTKQHYELNLTWNAVSGAGAYTIFRRQGGADTLIATVPADYASPSSYTYSYNAAGLTLGQSYDFVIVSTNLSPVRKGNSNFTTYSHNTPKPPVVRSITTNLSNPVTNEISGLDETVVTYKSSTSGGSVDEKPTGKVVRRWTITYPDKGMIDLAWSKGDGAENFDHYKIYRTTVGNAIGNFASSHNPSAWSGAALLTTAASSGTSHRDNTLNSIPPAQRKGTLSGTRTVYPIYYYRVTAVYKDASGNMHESLPSFYTNGGVNGIAAGGSAINPDDIFAAPSFFNPLLSWNKSTGWGSKYVAVGPKSLNGFQYMPESKVSYSPTATGGANLYGPSISSVKYSGISSYPGGTVQPFFIAWGPSTNSMGGTNTAAKFTLKHYFKNNGEAWPGWGFAMSYEIGTPQAVNYRTYGHSYVGGGTHTKFFTADFGQNGAAMEVTSVNEAVKLDGTTPLQGESSGFWFNEIPHS